MADQIFGVNCGFWDAINFDRTYSAEDMNRPYSRIVADGVFAANNGTPSSDLQVVAPGTSMNITVQKGQGIFAAKWFENPSSLLITVPSNTALYTRIDSVLVQVDKRSSGRVGSIVYRTGTPASEPEAPAINTTAGVVEYRVANISVAPSATKILQTAITDLRGSAACPWVTSLIEQVDTSTLWVQFQTAYENQFERYTDDYIHYIGQQRQAWTDFLSTLTDELTVSTNFTSYVSTYNTAAQVTNVPIGIAAYDPAVDVLQVYINGLLATPGVDYTLASNETSIDLTGALESGQTVVFVVYKSIVGADIASAVTLVQRLENKVDEFLNDTGWLPLTLEGSVAAYDSGSVPMGRVIGGRVYIRGSVKNVSAANTLLCTLPVGVRPGADLLYSSAAVTSGGSVKAVTITVTASSGAVKFKNGSVSATDRIILTQDFLADVTNGLSMVYIYRGTVATYSALPSTGLEAGDVYMIEQADPAHGVGMGDSVLWNGAEWQVMTAVISSASIESIINTIT